MIWIVETKVIAVREPLFCYATAIFMILTQISLEMRTTLLAPVRSSARSQATRRCTVSRSLPNSANGSHPSVSVGGSANQRNWLLVSEFKAFQHLVPHPAGRRRSPAVIFRASIKTMRSLRLQLCHMLAISAPQSHQLISFD